MESPPKRDFWDKLSLFSGVISAIVIALVGGIFTYLYNQRQLELNEIQKKQEHLVSQAKTTADLIAHLASEDQRKRKTALVIISVLGNPQLSANLAAIYGDKETLSGLTMYGGEKSKQYAAAALGKLGEQERVKAIAEAITNMFETGDPKSNYFVALLKHGQYLHLGPHDIKLLKQYADGKGIYARDLAPFLSRWEQKDKQVENDPEFRRLLKLVAEDAVMKEIADQHFTETAWAPAQQKAMGLGIKTPLGLSIVYDSLFFQGNAFFNRYASQTNEALGGTPASGVDEKAWLKKFSEVRVEYFANNPNEMLRRHASRPKEFLTLMEQDNWNLDGPIHIRGKEINREEISPGGTAGMQR